MTVGGLLDSALQTRRGADRNKRLVLLC
jgi:hypothetical protein